MNTQIMAFEGHELRTIEKDGEIWMAAVDIARALGYSSPHQAAHDVISRNKDRFEGYQAVSKILNPTGEKKRSGGKQNTIMLNLRGVMAFCLLARTKAAVRFQRWADSVLESHLNKMRSQVQQVNYLGGIKETLNLAVLGKIYQLFASKNCVNMRAVHHLIELSAAKSGFTGQYIMAKDIAYAMVGGEFRQDVKMSVSYIEVKVNEIRKILEKFGFIRHMERRRNGDYMPLLTTMRGDSKNE